MSELREAVPRDRIPPLAEVAPGVSPHFAAIVDRCLAKDPAQRFSSGDALREALEALREGERGDPVLAEQPYPGLTAFSAEERGVFFGRAAEVRTLLDRLRAESFVLVAGDSGVGKSSLCRAGVLPRVAEGALGGEWAVVSLVPGRHPLLSLTGAVAPLLGATEAELAAEVRDAPQAFARRLRLGMRGRPLLVFVDQLEELLTLADGDDATAVAEALGSLAEGVAGVRLLATARGDFLTHLATLPGLGDAISRALYLLRPLSEAGLREAIVGPARGRGFAFESESMVAALVSDGQAEGGLPLLQFALAELWERRDAQRRLISLAALDAIGGVGGALARHADAVMASMLPTQRAAARHILLRLVTAQGTRARRSAGELEVIGAEADTRRALDLLVRGRLLVVREADGAATYEVAHEALLSAWGQLRAWLLGDAELRVERQRLEQAAAEWERLGRPTEALWGTRLLTEVAALQPDALAPREAGFLVASRRAARRRRLLAVGAAVALPLMAALVYGGNVLLLRRQTARDVEEHVASARRSLEFARQRRAGMEELRKQSFTAFDAGLQEEGEKLWARALAEFEQADKHGYEEAHRELLTAVLRDPERHETRKLMADALYNRILLAEEFNQPSRVKELQDELSFYDEDKAYRRMLQAPARLEVETAPGATVSLERYEDDDHGRRWLRKVRELGVAPLSDVELEPGSYRLTLQRKDSNVVVFYPVLLARGERFRAHIPLPAAVPKGYVYVPPGRFLFGSDEVEKLRRTSLPGQPLHEVRTGGFLIARYEVTFQDWLDYLRTLPPAERDLRRPHADMHFGKIELVEQPNGRWLFALRQSDVSGQGYKVLEGEKLHYQDRDRRIDQDWRLFPVAGVSAEDAGAYVKWLDRSGRLPGAALCEVHQWERAARGADARLYPHGDLLEPDDANVDVTYGQKTLAFGLDEVGSHSPTSDSPFGISDLVGNVWEWMLMRSDSKDSPGHVSELPFRSGGSFYQDIITSRSNNHLWEKAANFHSPLVGLRVCAPPPVRDPPTP